MSGHRMPRRSSRVRRSGCGMPKKRRSHCMPRKSRKVGHGPEHKRKSSKSRKSKSVRRSRK